MNWKAKHLFSWQRFSSRRSIRGILNLLYFFLCEEDKISSFHHLGVLHETPGMTQRHQSPDDAILTILFTLACSNQCFWLPISVKVLLKDLSFMNILKMYPDPNSTRATERGLQCYLSVLCFRRKCRPCFLLLKDWHGEVEAIGQCIGRTHLEKKIKAIREKNDKLLTLYAWFSYWN